ncbi:MAG: hypothetical protein ACJ8AU_06230 [Gemmatimonadales bacterium]
MNDDRLRQAYQAILQQRQPGPRESCPSPEELRALVERTDEEQARLARLDHVMGCASCRGEFELLRSAATAAGVRRPWWRSAALAATVLLSVALGVSLARQRPSVPEPERGATGQLRLIAPRGEVDAAETGRFMWSAVPGAFRYDIEVLTPDGEVLLAASTPDTAMAAPALERGIALRWWVRARLPDGEHASDMVPFTLRR